MRVFAKVLRPSLVMFGGESNQVLTFNTAAKPLIDAGHTPGLIGRHRLLPRRAAV
jgi:hypothetical protein